MASVIVQVGFPFHFNQSSMPCQAALTTMLCGSVPLVSVSLEMYPLCFMVPDRNCMSSVSISDVLSRMNFLLMEILASTR
jgi:hypothetical protein